jgi:hypothetical protein
MDRRGFLSRMTEGLIRRDNNVAKADLARCRFLSACLGNGGFEAALLGRQGHVALQITLAMRAHEIALHPAAAQCLAVGRQPGRLSTMIDLATGRALYDLTPSEEHEFNGHAVFLSTGDELVLTEEHIETHIGRLSFYESATGQWLRSWPSQGIEPHEALIDKTRNRLIVANGGILQRGAIGEVDSSIVVLDLADGQVLVKTTLPEELASLSMRHLALAASGEVAVAMQDQDPQSDLRPLVGMMGLDGQLRFLEIPRDIAMTLRGYIGSVAIDRSSQVVCATSPKGNAALFWELARDRHTSDRWLGSVRIADGCGVAPSGQPGSFVVTGGQGDILLVETLNRSGQPAAPRSSVLARESRWQWDNHLTLLAA